MFVHCCHCRDCQRQTGSAFVLNALIETDRVEIRGGARADHDADRQRASARDLSLPGVPDRGLERLRRPRAVRFVRVGTLDEPTAITPDVHIYTRSKLPG